MTTKEQLRKYSGAIARAALGSFPPLGPVILELLDVTIPDQRLDRIERLLSIVESRLTNIEAGDIQEKLKSPELADVFEEILRQATKAVTEDRLRYLSAVLEKGLTDEELDHLQTKRLLEILNQLNDAEILMLRSYSEPHSISRFPCPTTAMQMDAPQSPFSSDQFHQSSSDDQAKERAMRQNYRSRLITLGLIGTMGRSVVGQSDSLCITQLGAMLLGEIDLRDRQPRVFGKPIDPQIAINRAMESLNLREKEIRREYERESKKAVAEVERAVNQAIRRFR